MSSSLDRRRAGTHRERTTLTPNPRCEVCGRPCFSFGSPMYPHDVSICGGHASGPAAAWYSRRRAAA